MPENVEGWESIDRWRAAIGEAHRRRWEKASFASRAGVVLSLFGFAAAGAIAILFLTHAL